MQSSKPHGQPNLAKLTLAGGLAGGLCGLISGPIAMFEFMWLENYLHGTMFLGLELLVAPYFGAVFGALQGMGVGVFWHYFINRPRRLTIAKLMLLVMVSGPCLAFILASPPAALLILGNGLLLLPMQIVAIIAAVRRHGKRLQRLQNQAVRDTDGRISSQLPGDIQFSDWGDTSLS